MASHRLGIRWAGILSEHRPELGEGVLDAVEVGTVWRKVKQARASALDHGSDLRSLVAGPIVHDDHISLAQFGVEDLADVGFSVDGAVEQKSTTMPLRRRPDTRVGLSAGGAARRV